MVLCGPENRTYNHTPEEFNSQGPYSGLQEQEKIEPEDHIAVVKNI